MSKLLVWGVVVLGASGVASCGRARVDGPADGAAGAVAESGRGAGGGASEGGAGDAGTSGGGETTEPGMGGAGASGAGASGAAGGSSMSTTSAGCGKTLPALAVPGTFSELASGCARYAIRDLAGEPDGLPSRFKLYCRVKARS